MQQFGTRQPPAFEEKSSGGLKAVIVVFAVFLFALSGLMMGFAVGAFTRHPTSTPAQSNVTQQKPQATPAQNVNVTALGGIACPIFSPTFSFSQTADGATSYQLSVTITDRSISQTAHNNCGEGKPLKIPGITCKVWITNNNAGLTVASLTKNYFQPATNMQNAFPDEMQNVLTFTSGQAVQDCSSTGATTWSYSLSPTLPSGTYHLAVAADWQGQSWNWSWRDITVKGA